MSRDDRFDPFLKEVFNISHYAAIMDMFPNVPAEDKLYPGGTKKLIKALEEIKNKEDSNEKVNIDDIESVNIK